jgi:hypothetical protein
VEQFSLWYAKSRGLGWLGMTPIKKVGNEKEQKRFSLSY